MKPILPAGLKAYKRTPIFDEHTLPAGLRREHRGHPSLADRPDLSRREDQSGRTSGGQKRRGPEGLLPRAVMT